MRPSHRSQQDCNKYLQQRQRHVMFSTRKIRPSFGMPLPLLLVSILFILLNRSLFSSNNYYLSYGQAVTTVEGEDGSVGKDLPEKGDTKCPSLADRFNYFTNSSSDSSHTAADLWLLPCKETDTTNDGSGNGNNEYDDVPTGLESVELPDHAIVVYVYAALPAYASDFRNLFSWGVVGFLDEISLEYDVLSNFSIPVDLFNYTERRQNPRNIDAQIIFQYVVSNKIKEHEASWWYEYQFIFYCYYGNAHINRVGKPILKTDLDNIKKDNGRLKLNSVRQRLNYYLRYGIDIINVFNIQPLSYGILGISIEDPTYSLTPFIDGPPTLPPTPSPSYYETINDDLLFNDTDPMTTTINGTKSNGGTGEDNNGSGDDDDNMSPPSGTDNDGVAKNESTYDNYPDKTEGTYPEFVTYTSPINVQLWDWRRFFGLFIFSATLIGTIILTQLAAYRRRQIMKQTIWGNIGTEQGVEALLNTGWKFKDSTLMEVYNKAGMGYRDDDSMLLGGHEQTHTTAVAGTSSGDDGGNVSSTQHETSYGIGGEIAFTPDGSLSTPEYHSEGNS